MIPNPVGKTDRLCPHPQPLCLDLLNRRETRRAQVAPKIGRGEPEPEAKAG
ncbi:hypothetical protein [Chamaesiphon polymorphus]|uniref:hypothetical protein n=1 Tax=Chamaesiphon polymorphus TaxID=2107691 RepID=UPI0015E730A6|nr:hypothetical protein [Chamaesiphon polymorphus]